MPNFDSTVALVSKLLGTVGASMSELREILEPRIQIGHPTSQQFAVGFGDGPEAGLAVELSGKRSDERVITWMVEAFVYAASDQNWSVNVKGEIDLDDRDGEDHCVLNEQQVVTQAADLPTAIADAAALVVNYPLEDLLTPGWEPPDWDHYQLG